MLEKLTHSVDPQNEKELLGLPNKAYANVYFVNKRFFKNYMPTIKKKC